MKKHYILFMMAITIAVIGAMFLAPTPTVMAGDMEQTPTPHPDPDPGLDWEWWIGEDDSEAIHRTWWEESPREWYEYPAWWGDNWDYCNQRQEWGDAGERLCAYPLVYKHQGVWYTHTTLVIMTQQGQYGSDLTAFGDEISYKYEILSDKVETLHVLVEYTETPTVQILHSYRYWYLEDHQIIRNWWLRDANIDSDGNISVAISDMGYRTIHIEFGRFGGAGEIPPLPYRGWRLGGAMISFLSPWGITYGGNYTIQPPKVMLPEKYESVPLGNTFIR